MPFRLQSLNIKARPPFHLAVFYSHHPNNAQYKSKANETISSAVYIAETIWSDPSLQVPSTRPFPMRPSRGAQVEVRSWVMVAAPI
jgi:hypothetical protein